MALAHATSSPDAETIRATTREILARPEYRLKAPRSGDLAWLQRMWEWIVAILRPFFNLFNALWAVSPVLAIAFFVVLVVTLVALLWHIVYTFRVALRERLDPGRYTAAASRPPDPADLEVRARQAAERQDYITAVRLLFLACLLRLEPAERRVLRKGATNHEYLRRFRNTPAYEPLGRFVDVIDFKWYGQGLCELADFDACRQAHAAILALRRA